GSAAFIVGTVLSGQAIGRFGIIAVVWLNAALLAMTASAARLVPVLLPTPEAPGPITPKPEVQGFGALLRLPIYRRIVLVAALILGSHAMHDSFAVIRWGAAGVGPSTAGLLWSLSVAAGPPGIGPSNSRMQSSNAFDKRKGPCDQNLSRRSLRFDLDEEGDRGSALIRD